jgi:cytoskeletal protein CcmA (bactofilin family)
MFGKSKDDIDQKPPAPPKLERPAAPVATEQSADDRVSAISRDMTVVGKIFGDGVLNVFGRVEGELRAVNVVIKEGAHVEGDVVAEELTVGGHVKGSIHAYRVKLDGTAVVEGDIFHRSLSIEENAHFEGSSKREENPIDTAHPLPKRPVLWDERDSPVDSGWKPNGAPSYDGRPGLAAS